MGNMMIKHGMQAHLMQRDTKILQYFSGKQSMEVSWVIGVPLVIIYFNGIFQGVPPFMEIPKWDTDNKRKEPGGQLDLVGRFKAHPPTNQS